MDFLYSRLPMRFIPQLSNMRAWRKVWLMDTNSFFKTALSCLIMAAFPFILLLRKRWFLEKSFSESLSFQWHVEKNSGKS